MTSPRTVNHSQGPSPRIAPDSMIACDSRTTNGTLRAPKKVRDISHHLDAIDVSIRFVNELIDLFNRDHQPSQDKSGFTHSEAIWRLEEICENLLACQVPLCSILRPNPDNVPMPALLTREEPRGISSQQLERYRVTQRHFNSLVDEILGLYSSHVPEIKLPLVERFGIDKQDTKRVVAGAGFEPATSRL